MKKRIFAIIFSCVAITFAYFFFDVNNIVAGMGIPTQEINWDIASIVIGNLIVIALYLITYNLIDNRSIEKDKNQREVALLLLNKTYDQSAESVKLFDYPGAAEKAAQKCDFSKTAHQDSQLMYYLEFPFEFHEQIVEFASTGIISKEEFDNYLELKEAFRTHINRKIMFFDKEELSRETKKGFIDIFERVTGKSYESMKQR